MDFGTSGRTEFHVMLELRWHGINLDMIQLDPLTVECTAKCYELFHGRD